MHNLGLLLSVAILWALAVISPGPNFLMTVRLSITRSRRDGILAVAGIGVGTVIWGAAACFGIQALFVAAPWMYWTLKLLGASYLIFMGLKLIWSSRRGNQSPFQKQFLILRRLSRYARGLEGCSRRRRTAHSGTSPSPGSGQAFEAALRRLGTRSQALGSGAQSEPI